MDETFRPGYGPERGALARRPGDQAALDSARVVARILDEAFEIPGTGWRIGIDPLIGLVPGIGDVLGAILSSWILLVAVRLRAPASVIGRMALNVAVDTVVGSVPLAGDLADFAWKANVKNVRLLEGWLDRPGPTARSSGLLVAGIVLALLLVVAAVLFALWRVAAWAAGVVTG